MSSFRPPISLFLFFLFFSFLAAAACLDSDGGDEPLIAGACSTESFYAQDNCVAEGLSEYYCSGEQCISSIEDCPYGCLMGACRSAPPEPLETCKSIASSIPAEGTVSFQKKAGAAFEVLGVDFTVVDWSGASLWVEDSESVMLQLVQGEEFDYGAFTMTFIGFDESTEPVQGTIDFIEKASPNEYCLVVWTPRSGYYYAPSEAELSFEISRGSLQLAGKAYSFAAEIEAMPFSCAYSIDGSPYSPQFYASISELVDVNLPAFTVGSHFVSAYCSRGSLELQRTVNFDVLFESLEDALLVSPENASTQFAPVSFDFWLYGNHPSYECELRVDSDGWLSISGVGAPGYSYQGVLPDLDEGEHSAGVRCKPGGITEIAADSDWFYSNENEFIVSGALPSIVSPLNNSNHSAGEVNVLYEANCADCECVLYLNNSLEDERYPDAAIETVEFELAEGNYSVIVSCNESNSTPFEFHVLPEDEQFVNVPDIDSPFYGKSYDSGEAIHLAFEVSGSFDEYACYERLDEAENYSFVINATDSTFILIGDYYEDLDEGAHSMDFECRGLDEGNETEYNNSVTILFEVGEEIVIVEQNEELPALPSVVPPMPTPQPEQKQDYLQLDCPQSSSSSSTELNAVLYVNGRPVCDSNTRVTVARDGEPGQGVLVVCDSQSGEHELSVSSSKAGSYSVTVESLSYGQSASCSFARSKGSVQAEEAPDLPVYLAVLAGLFAFAVLQRKQ